MKKALKLTLAVLGCAAILAGCKEKTTTKETTVVTTAKPTTATTTTEKKTTAQTTTEQQTLSYNFVIYEKDSDNEDLTNNTVVATYTMSFTDGTKTVTDTLIKDGDKYYFVQGGTDYITITSSGMIEKGYFKDYSECASNTEIDISWSYCAVNGAMASKGINETTLTGLTAYGLVINGWK